MNPISLLPWRQFLTPRAALYRQTCRAPSRCRQISEDSLQFGSSRRAARVTDSLAMKFAGARGFGQSDGRCASIHSDTMSKLSRRSFLAGSAALIAAPRRAGAGAPPTSISSLSAPVPPASPPRAAPAPPRRAWRCSRRASASAAAASPTQRCSACRSISARIGCVIADSNPLAAAGAGRRARGLPGAARAAACASARAMRATAELENFLAALVRARRALIAAGRPQDRRGGAQRAAGRSRRLARDHRVHPRALRLRQGSRRGLGRGSRARRRARDLDAFCRQGYGALLAKLAAGLPPQLNTPVTLIDCDRRGVERAHRQAAACARAR